MARKTEPDPVEMIEAWYSSDTGLAAFRLQVNLMKRLVGLKPGDRLLDVGCGTGRHLLAFKREGAAVTGLDVSREVLDEAARRLGRRSDLHCGRAEDLPFNDNEFDVVTMFNCLEGTDAPDQALDEAFRVAGRCVFVGVINALSLSGLGWRVEGYTTKPQYRRARFYSVWGLKEMLAARTDPRRIRWATAGLLPSSLAARVWNLESSPRLQKWPFGAFIGMASDVTYIARTDRLELKAESRRPRPAPAPATASCVPFSRGGSRSSREREAAR
jgi:SAM-dependent methyltransferase